MNTVRIVILDHHALSRHGLRVLVEQVGIGAGEVVDFAEAEGLLAHLERASAHILLLSDQLPAEKNAVKLVRCVHQRNPGLAQIVIGSRLNTDYIGALFAGGARGYVYHRSKLEETIPAALKSVLAGEPYLSSEAAALPYYQRRVHALTARDLEVLSLLAAGQSVQDIAQRIGVSRRVIYATRSRLKTYLEVNNNEQIIPAAVARGLLAE